MEAGVNHLFKTVAIHIPASHGACVGSNPKIEKGQRCHIHIRDKCGSAQAIAVERCESVALHTEDDFLGRCAINLRDGHFKVSRRDIDIQGLACQRAQAAAGETIDAHPHLAVAIAESNHRDFIDHTRAATVGEIAHGYIDIRQRRTAQHERSSGFGGDTGHRAGAIHHQLENTHLSGRAICFECCHHNLIVAVAIHVSCRHRYFVAGNISIGVVTQLECVAGPGPGALGCQIPFAIGIAAIGAGPVGACVERSDDLTARRAIE
ncbi:MAG: hypothetical protein BWY63_03095 [Chloroflexi bacterium ADurb.Bin360]|nr:MAG: hypothetical protein BWY63_03095 [Chloroflexi bacterium ADurb.Bin360]